MGADGVLHVVTVLPDFGLPQVGGYFRKEYEKEALGNVGKALAEWVVAHVPPESGGCIPMCCTARSTTRSCAPPTS